MSCTLDDSLSKSLWVTSLCVLISLVLWSLKEGACRGHGMVCMHLVRHGMVCMRLLGCFGAVESYSVKALNKQQKYTHIHTFWIFVFGF